MKLTLNIIGSDITLKATGESRLYILNQEELYNQAASLFEGDSETVILDLIDIKFIDSTAFNSLLKLHRIAEKMGKRFEIDNVNDEALRLFEILRLTEVLTIKSTNGELVSNAA